MTEPLLMPTDYLSHHNQYTNNHHHVKHRYYSNKRFKIKKLYHAEKNHSTSGARSSCQPISSQRSISQEIYVAQ